MTWTAATKATAHPLTHTRLDIRLNPARGDPSRPFSPGSSLSGDIALVVDNEEGVKDVKHKLSVKEVTVKAFWEARSLTDPVHAQEYHRGGTVFVPLTSGQEDVLLMPGVQGGDSVESSWSFEITLPEKSTVEDSFNSSSKDKGKSSSPIHLAAGPPPSFAGQGFSVEYILEASVVFTDGEASTELDERGHRVAGELELVERRTFPFRPDGEKILVSNEFQQKDWTKHIEVVGAEGKALGSLNVSVHPPPLPIPASFPSIPFDINLRLSPPAVEKKEKKGFFGLGKKKEDPQHSAAPSPQDAFVVESVTAKVVVRTTGEADVTLSELATLNISSNHPTLSSLQGLTTEIHLDFASSAPSNWDATLGSFSLPNASRQFLFSLTLALSSPANPATHPLVVDLPLPFIGAPYQPTSPPPHISSSRGYDEPPPPAGDPPSFDGPFEGEPPAFDQPPALGAVSGSSGLPPGYD